MVLGLTNTCLLDLGVHGIGVQYWGVGCSHAGWSHGGRPNKHIHFGFGVHAIGVQNGGVGCSPAGW